MVPVCLKKLDYCIFLNLINNFKIVLLFQRNYFFTIIQKRGHSYGSERSSNMLPSAMRGLSQKPSI